MEEHVRSAVDAVIPIVDAIGAIVIVTGVAVTFVLWALSELRIRRTRYETVRLGLGRYLALGLEFQLASDILSTAIAPTFEDIGNLAAIAAIRTALNYFLAKEIDKEQQEVAEARERSA